MKPPKHLSREAKKIWTELQSDYQITDPGGLAILQTAMESFDRVRECQGIIAQEGMQTQDRFQQWKAHPLLCVERDARAQMLAGLKMLNLDIEPLRDGPGRPGILRR
jgi:P27 family predicted phage terminase small subunit